MSQASGKIDESNYIRDLEELWTPEELAGFLKVKVSTIYEHCRRRSASPIPHSKVGKFLRFNPRDVREWLYRNRRGHSNDRGIS